MQAGVTLKHNSNWLDWVSNIIISSFHLYFLIHPETVFCFFLTNLLLKNVCYNFLDTKWCLVLFTDSPEPKSVWNSYLIIKVGNNFLKLNREPNCSWRQKQSNTRMKWCWSFELRYSSLKTINISSHREKLTQHWMHEISNFNEQINKEAVLLR